MKPNLNLALFLLVTALSTASAGEKWTRFRGPNGLGVSSAKGVVGEWSSTKNIVWKKELPGPGSSSPIIIDNTKDSRVFLTAYSGYGLNPNEGDQTSLVRHVLCFDRREGDTLWHETYEPKLPEHEYAGEGAYHGYAASTPTTDGERLYVFFGKSGVYSLSLDGEKLWHVKVGDGTHGWGSGTSPVLHGDLLLVNASVESGSLVALDKRTGAEQWRTKNIREAWNTPLVVQTAGGSSEIIVSINKNLLGLSPSNGSQLWSSDGIHRYVCPSVIAHKDIVYAIGGGHTSLAVRVGGRGDVTNTRRLWREATGTNVSSPIYYRGHLYWARRGVVSCQDATTGKIVANLRLEPPVARVWSSPILIGEKLFFISQRQGTYVVSANPELKQLQRNVFEEDGSRSNASPAVSNGQILLRTDRYLYCIGEK